MSRSIFIASMLISGLSVSINAQEAIPQDPFAAEVLIPKASYSHQVVAQSYYQANKINRDNQFNPNLINFPNYQQLSVVDWQLKSHWQSNIQFTSRAIASYEKSNIDDDKNLDLLEGYFSGHSDDYAWQWQLGRVHTQWSNGFNWHLMNVLSPYRNRPYIDIDNPIQQKGWDILSIKYQHQQWFYQLLVADYQRTRTATHQLQYVARLGYQGRNDLSLLVHKIPEQKASIAASYNRLLNNNMSLRAQWKQSSIREQSTQVLIGSQTQRKQYQQALLGLGYTVDAGHDFRLEYLYSQHGFDEADWAHISKRSLLAYHNIFNRRGNGDDYAYLGAALSSLGLGQLRQRYLYLSYASPLSERLWQYRQSVQVNLDDDSQLHRLTLLKSWNNNLTSRVQLEAFNGCSQCEYGLTPNKHNIRFVLNWAF